MIKRYSLKEDRYRALSEHFTAGEFACRDGSDEILIDDALIDALEEIRAHFNMPVTITSGYRSPEYNASINGAKKSKHMLGQAADIRVQGVLPIKVAAFAQEIGMGGIGLYDYGGMSGFTHIDTRDGNWRGVQISSKGSSLSVSKYFPTVKKGSTGQCVVILQRAVGAEDDGIFGKKTLAAVKEYQKKKGLEPDGIVGKLTWRCIIDG